MYRLDIGGLGRAGASLKTPENIYEAIQDMADGESQELRNVREVMERIEYQELRGDKDLDYWIRYNMRFGHYHLINPSHRLGLR